MPRHFGTDSDHLANMKDDEIDFTEAPELGEEFFCNALVRVPANQTVTIRLDSDVLEWFKAQGPGYQTRINQLLRQYMQAQEQREQTSASK